jgi:hypothetical protein
MARKKRNGKPKSIPPVDMDEEVEEPTPPTTPRSRGSKPKAQQNSNNKQKMSDEDDESGPNDQPRKQKQHQADDEDDEYEDEGEESEEYEEEEEESGTEDGEDMEQDDWEPRRGRSRSRAASQNKKGGASASANGPSAALSPHRPSLPSGLVEPFLYPPSCPDDCLSLLPPDVAPDILVRLCRSLLSFRLPFPSHHFPSLQEIYAFFCRFSSLLQLKHLVVIEAFVGALLFPAPTPFLSCVHVGLLSVVWEFAASDGTARNSRYLVTHELKHFLLILVPLQVTGLA